MEKPRETEDGLYVPDDQEELMTYVLTEDIFVEILAARLQVNFTLYNFLYESHLFK